MEEADNFRRSNYSLAVVLALFLQQDLPSAFALSFEQQVWPFAHFFFFLPLSAKVTPVTSRAAAVSTNNLFIYVNFNNAGCKNRD